MLFLTIKYSGCHQGFNLVLIHCNRICSVEIWFYSFIRVDWPTLKRLKFGTVLVEAVNHRNHLDKP